VKGEFHATWIGVDGAQGAETLSYLHAVGFSCMLISCITTQHLQYMLLYDGKIEDEIQ
jgi:Na+-transporting NADH:ubiquinone oxidoreductase subunit NqrB